MPIYRRAELLDLVEGACFLAAGGGGSRASGLSLASSFPPDLKIDVISVEEAAASDKLSAVVAYIGAPTAIADIKKPVAAIDAFRKLNQQCRMQFGKEIGQIVPVEIGALSSLVACTVAGYEGLPVVDADGAGRAVPSLTNLTFGTLSTDPTVISNVKSEGVFMTVTEAAQAEELVRPIIAGSAFGNQAGLGLWAMDGPTLTKSAPITRTLELCRGAGQTLRTADGDKVQALLDFLTTAGRNPARVARGKLASFTQTTTGGFNFGMTVIESESDGARLRIYSQNENLILWNDRFAAPAVMVPDPLCYITAAGQPFANADITDAMVGTEVILVGMPARAELRLPPIAGSFAAILVQTGYAGRYVPFERLLEMNA